MMNDIMTVDIKKKSSAEKTWVISPEVKSGSKKWFSANDVIDAYMRGKKEQQDENNRILREQFEKNLKGAKKIGIRLFNELRSKKIQCRALELKPVNITDFDFLFVVPKKDFISDSFREVYKLFRMIKDDNNKKESFKIHFSFMPYTTSLDEDVLLSDGYILKYGDKN